MFCQSRSQDGVRTLAKSSESPRHVHQTAPRRSPEATDLPVKECPAVVGGLLRVRYGMCSLVAFSAGSEGDGFLRHFFN